MADADLAQAYLAGAYLRAADLTGAQLDGANLQEADLRYATLEGANLRGADLTHASIQEGSLRNADLRGANLTLADLRLTDLRGAQVDDTTQMSDYRRLAFDLVNNGGAGRDLRDAFLPWSDFAGVDFAGANLSGADLRNSDLSGANLTGADLQRANLRERRRQWYASNALPESRIQRRQMASARCEHAWRTQRPANDWKGFLGNFREVLAIAREEAALLSAQTGLRPYDALMDRFEPGMTLSLIHISEPTRPY